MMIELTTEKRKKSAKWIIGNVVVCIVIFLGLQNIDSVGRAVSEGVNLIMPLIVGLVFAAILNVPMSFFESHLWVETKNKKLKKLRRPVAFIISLVLIAGIIAGIICLIIPEIVTAVQLVVQSIVDFIDEIKGLSAAELENMLFGDVLSEVNWDNIRNTIQAWLKNKSHSIVNTAVGTVGSLVGGIFNFFVACVFSIYILFGKEKLKKQMSRLIRAWTPKSFGEWLIHASKVASRTFSKFVSGQTLEAIILGTLCMIGMVILRIPYAPMVGALIGVTALVPVVGAFVGGAIGAFVIMTVNPVKAVVFLIFLVILQQLEGNIIYPKVMGKRENLPGMWILAVVTIGGGIAGPVGMLVAVPLASTTYALLSEATYNREKIIERAEEACQKN